MIFCCLDFVVIPILFYIIVAAAQVNLDELRENGWLFDIPGGVKGQPEKWWRFYTYFGEPIYVLIY